MSLLRASLRPLALSVLGAVLLTACEGGDEPGTAPPAAKAASKPAAEPAAPVAPAVLPPAQSAPAAPAAQSEPAPPAAAAEPRAAAKAAVGQAAPDFTLKDTSGREHTLSALAKEGKVVVLEWFNPDCPIVRNYQTPTSDMNALAQAYADKNVVWLAINSGAAGKQGAGLERNQQAIEEFKLSYPVLLDESGDVGRLYSAKHTPHMYVIDAKGVLAYAGAIDDGDPSAKGELNYVRQALDELLAGKPVTKASTEAFGCSVKYAK